MTELAVSKTRTKYEFSINRTWSNPRDWNRLNKSNSYKNILVMERN